MSSVEEGTKEKEVCFLGPEDVTILTDYLIILLTQVKKVVMTDADRTKNREGSTLTYGLRCRHCGGLEKGSYFPSSKKSLQACTASLHNHLLNCSHVPPNLVRAVKLSKNTHKSQLSLPRVDQRTFFRQMWERVNGDYDGFDDASVRRVFQKVNAIVESCALKNERNVEAAAYTEEDFQLVLECLRMPFTPDNTDIFENAPDADITPEPLRMHNPPNKVMHHDVGGGNVIRTEGVKMQGTLQGTRKRVLSVRKCNIISSEVKVEGKKWEPNKSLKSLF